MTPLLSLHFEAGFLECLYDFFCPHVGQSWHTYAMIGVLTVTPKDIGAFVCSSGIGSPFSTRVSTQVARVDVKSDHLVVRLAMTSGQQNGETTESDVLNHDDDRDRSQHHIGDAQADASTNVLTIPWKKSPSKLPREIIPPVRQ
jgi:hypothetical protein